MKILKLTFMNLNSLYGTWSIDFTEPEYQSNGIFALTGPTGSGKSTILDAICLALYGETPRLGRITQKENEIMSRNTGECFSEVVFQTQTGTYMCHWSQHRARKRADGKLADAKHEITDAVTGTVLDTKKREVLLRVESITGMDFSRFTRSILLAQGGFDSFLKADTDEKSKILEQITGVEIYTEISKMVFERQKDEKHSLDLLRAGLQDITLLDEEQLNSLHRDLEEKIENEGLAKGSYDTICDAILWLQGIDRIKGELTVLEEQKRLIELELKEFLPERQRLEDSLRAAELDGVYAELIKFRDDQQSDTGQLEKSASALPDKQKALEEAACSQADSKGDLVALRIDQEKLHQQVTHVRLLDQRIEGLRANQQMCSDRIKNLTEQVVKKEALIKEHREALESISSDSKAVQSYIDTHLTDELLVSDYSAIAANLKELKERNLEICDKEQSAKVLEGEREELQEKQISQKSLITEIDRQIKEIDKGLFEKKGEIEKLLDGRLLREYKEEYRTKLKEMTLINKIIQLKEERRRLITDNPCPLCGSLDHPYAQGLEFSSDEVEERVLELEARINTIEGFEEESKKLSIGKDTMVTDRQAANEILIGFIHSLVGVTARHDELVDQIARIHARNQQSQDDLLKILEPLGIKTVQAQSSEALILTLRSRLETWKDKHEQMGALQKRHQELFTENTLASNSIGSLQEQMGSEKSELERSIPEIDEFSRQREDLFGTKAPDIEERRVQEQVGSAEQEFELAEKTCTTINNEVISLSGIIDQLKRSIATRVPQLEGKETIFRDALVRRAFKDEPHFMEVRLELDERNELASQAQTLDTRDQKNKTMVEDRSRRLTGELIKELTEKDPEELLSKKDAFDTSLQALREDMSKIRYDLDQDRQNKERIKEKQSLIVNQENVFTRWNTLNSYIGSADGKRFRNYAQGLTFELMVFHANRQLQKMTDRYLLKRNDQAPLELNVIDTYQAGEVRSIKNLSGGESFIVSLSLALGLSNMSSRKIRVDSLFLDEGFGTLDEDVLDTALEMLSGLHEDNKLIGVISHVPALKERIGVQIMIDPQSGGKSSISGPGCTKA